MAPPKRKDNTRSSKTKEPLNGESWRSEIEDLTINEDRWTCVIGMIVETRLEHGGYLDLFNEAAEDETREAIFSLSYAKLVRGAKLLAKSDPRQGICHFASKQIEDGGEESIGLWLICRLIKLFVNRAKIKNLEILQSRVRMEEDITKEIEILASTGAKSFDKQNTRLRKRGEEWRDRVRIDDAPINGPDLYVVLSGFHDPTLPSELLKAGLPLTAVFKMLRPGEDVGFDHPKGRNFWSSFEATLNDPATAPEYGRVICQTFCPPEISVSMIECDVDTLKSDAYRRISFLMYDLPDIMRNHASYIRKMKLQTNLDEVRPKFQTTETYDAIMRLLPEECATVPIVLDALLAQLEGLKVDIDLEDKHETFGDGFQTRINYLNETFHLLDVSRAESSAENVNPRVIVHGDDLGRNNHHCSWKNAIPDDFGVRVLRQSAIFLLWSKVSALTREQNAMHAYHIQLISDCFDATTDSLTTCHYLHLLLFDKMVNGEISRSDLRERRDIEMDVNDRPTKSGTVFCRESLTKNSHFRSDSAIDYGKEISETFECPELFRLVDAREMFGSSHTASPPSFSEPNSGTLDLGDFDGVQLLSPEVFSQVFFNCSQEFSFNETRYFAPTDSMLVVFHDDRSKDNISEQHYAAGIRTPVCLRDFSRFIIEEEKEWIEKEEEMHGRRMDEEATLRKAVADTSGDYSSPGSFYSDADFILPNSIKGSEVRKQKSRQSLINRTEPSQPSRDKLPAQAKATRKGKQVKETNSPKGEIPKRKGSEINPGRESRERLETTARFPPLKKIPSLPSIGDREPSTFLGYDVADHRVQVSGSASEFRSKDGTVVKVNLEEWTYGIPRLQIIVQLLGNNLVMHNLGEDDPTFHFTTANGISVGFRPTSRIKEGGVRGPSASGDSITKRNYQGSKMGRESDTLNGSWTAEMAVDPGFRVSWPSGLVVETLPGDGPSDPFNIKQSYLSKGPECTGVSRETQRVYLREGTIIVLHNDSSVLLLRSNGRIVSRSGSSDEDEAQHPAGERSLEVLEPDGKRYEMLNGEVIKELGEELVITSSDYEADEKFSRRNDGTNILISSRGCLAVCFPDGSRITTGYVIDEHPVCCEWTEEEIQRFYPANNVTDNILRDDGFVSVLLTCCMEHKNYATVTYDQSKNDCTLSMPGEVGVHVSPDTLIGVTVGTATSLKVHKDRIVFSERMGESPGESSSSVFDLGRWAPMSSEPDAPFLRTTDSLGDVFTVDLNGKTSYKKLRIKSDPAKEYHRENNSPRPVSKGYRLFAVKRDLSAYEHLHRSDREAQENEQADIIFYRQVPHRADQKLRTTLTTLEPITASQAWLQPHRVPSIRPTNEERRDLVRSTYSVPCNYLIPYGKNGFGIRDRTWNIPLNVNGPNYSTPEVLLARTIQTIKSREDNVIKKLQTALGRYWGKAINNFRNYQSSPPCETAATFEEREFDDWLKDFALGRLKTLDRKLYVAGLIEKGAKERSECQLSGIKNSESDDKKAAEEIEWYKNCLRDRTVVPYFSDIPGACFLWVLECVNKMGEPSGEDEEAREKKN